MGYCIDSVKSKFEIKKENKEKALLALKGLAAKVQRLMWIDTDVITESEYLEEALDECGWELQHDGDCEIIGIEFQREKLGDEDQIFAAIAPFVENESFIEMRGEDGDCWRWIFKNGECKEVHAKQVFEDD